MIKNFKIFESKYGDSPVTFDHERYIMESTDIDYLEELLKCIESDLKRMENPSNFKLSAKMRNLSVEEYVEMIKKSTLTAKKIAKDRLKELMKFEEISWWKDGELSEDDDESKTDDTTFSVGDKVLFTFPVYYWSNEIISRNGKWEEYGGRDYDIVHKIRKISYCNKNDYSGQIIIVGNKWSWFQTKNIVKSD